MLKKGNVVLGILFSVGLGVLLHFTYEWSGENKIVGYFSAVGESTWEHLKLLFFPVLLFTVIEWIFGKRKRDGFLLSRTVSLLTGMLWIVSAFYTVSGIVGKADMPVINIAIFVIGVIITFLLTEIIQKSIFNAPRYGDLIALVILIVFTLLFVVWTYDPPSIGLFREP